MQRNYAYLIYTKGTLQALRYLNTIHLEIVPFWRDKNDERFVVTTCIVTTFSNYISTLVRHKVIYPTTKYNFALFLPVFYYLLCWAAAYETLSFLLLSWGVVSGTPEKNEGPRLKKVQIINCLQFYFLNRKF